MVKAQAHQQLSPFVTRALVVVLVVVWVLQTLGTMIVMFEQLPNNTNMSAFYTTLLYNTFTPLIVLLGVLAYRRRKAGVPLLIESVLVAAIVWLCANATSGISAFLLTHSNIVLGGSLDWWYLELMVCVVSVVATLVVLWYAHRLGKW